ncbi:GPI transamidase component PIG-T [Hypsizygus marmoreus]|uniref:GPI transamidase component PIG-T n=1 Tax=Hypsizygus marmoreus TaxID=39966 RepID=A0A369J655_HYPMA|nr:GPI transamidase component PIG-T [Hypsizygus marmoreus]
MQAGWKAKFLLGLSLCLSALGSPIGEQFDEQLTLKSLRDGKVLSRFSFTTLLKGASPRNPQTLGSDDISQHYTIFPLALGQILREYAITEMHLTLNAGNWNYDRWGYPEEAGVGTGAELWAWMGDGPSDTVDDRWKGLRNALAGLFCASLGSLDEQRTTAPVRSFEPEGNLPDWGPPHQIRHASLASEHVCTENLTPFLKLLPCKSLSGIASLLNPHRLFDADWHGMGVHVLWREGEGVEVRLAFQSISDPVRYSLGRKQDWDFRTLFDRTIDRKCPVAQSSHVVVALPTSAEFDISPEPTSNAAGLATFDVATLNKPLDVGLRWRFDFQYPLDFDSPTSSLSVQRTLRGSSQARGQLSLVLKNHRNTSLHVVYLETMPWLVQFYLHTLQIYINGSRNDDAMSDMTYMPSIPHARPATFQCVLAVPPGGALHLTMDVAKSFLRYTEHPPDAQRGWDLPPAILTPFDPTSNRSANDPIGGRIYTPALLVDLATPDFSMPYNVIIFTCSLVAFIFGSVFNLLTRKFVVVHIEPTKDKKE